MEQSIFRYGKTNHTNSSGIQFIGPRFVRHLDETPSQAIQRPLFRVTNPCTLNTQAFTRLTQNSYRPKGRVGQIRPTTNQLNE